MLFAVLIFAAIVLYFLLIFIFKILMHIRPIFIILFGILSLRMLLLVYRASIEQIFESETLTYGGMFVFFFVLFLAFSEGESFCEVETGLGESYFNLVRIKTDYGLFHNKYTAEGYWTRDLEVYTHAATHSILYALIGLVLAVLSAWHPVPFYISFVLICLLIIKGGVETVLELELWQQIVVGVIEVLLTVFVSIESFKDLVNSPSKYSFEKIDESMSLDDRDFSFLKYSKTEDKYFTYRYFYGNKIALVSKDYEGPPDINFNEYNDLYFGKENDDAYKINSIDNSKIGVFSGTTIKYFEREIENNLTPIYVDDLYLNYRIDEEMFNTAKVDKKNYTAAVMTLEKDSVKYKLFFDNKKIEEADYKLNAYSIDTPDAFYYIRLIGERHAAGSSFIESLVDETHYDNPYNVKACLIKPLENLTPSEKPDFIHKIMETSLYVREVREYTDGRDSIIRNTVINNFCKPDEFGNPKYYLSRRVSSFATFNEEEEGLQSYFDNKQDSYDFLSVMLYRWASSSIMFTQKNIDDLEQSTLKIIPSVGYKDGLTNDASYLRELEKTGERTIEGNDLKVTGYDGYSDAHFELHFDITVSQDDKYIINSFKSLKIDEYDSNGRSFHAMYTPTDVIARFTKTGFITINSTLYY